MTPSNLMAVAGKERLTVPEAARLLGIAGEAVYQLIFEGVLPGRPGSDGAVYVSVQDLDEYADRTGRTVRPS